MLFICVLCILESEINREAQKVKEKVAKEIAERLSKQHEEEQAKRRAGAAIAPPQALLEEAPTTSTQNENFESPAQFGKAGSRGRDNLLNNCYAIYKDKLIFIATISFNFVFSPLCLHLFFLTFILYNFRAYNCCNYKQRLP